ncbi:MAG: phenylacetate-CoA oxygenase/reductase subunit PaaK [Betaproteobacteria bacterium]|jgi:ring-1,2-phenylacetyl-CoA epoxidase subunit PaaE|nr:phenylacetate-CoA oxygenase/reductase subunit PaaK [Betaproteobacteria bacterium]
MNTPASSTHFHALRVSHIQPDADDAVIVSFDVPQELAATYQFVAGQYLTLRHDVQGQDLRRSYSICAAPGEPLRVGVRKVPGGVFSTWLHEHLQPGQTVQVLPPQGHFGDALTRLEQPPAHTLLIAAGSGITPILSIAKSLLQSSATARVTLIYSNRQVVSTMFKEELEDLKNRYLTRLSIHAVFSREVVDAPEDSPLAAGRLDRQRMARFWGALVDPKTIDQAFVCGPHAFNDEAQAALSAAGLPADSIHIERFGVPVSQTEGLSHAPQPGDADDARVVLIRDGLTREFGFRKGDPSVLDAAARAGLDVPYSCKSGVCATCRCKVVEGRVRMDRNFALEKADLDAGFVLSCQAHPLTPRVVLSFDER